MEDMFKYIDDIDKSNVIVEYEVDDNKIRIKTSNSKNVIIERKDSYIEFLNDIIKKQQQYKDIERKKYLLKKERFSKFERILMYILLLGSIALVIYFPNVFTSLILLIFVLSTIVSEVSHIHNVMELRKINASMFSTKSLIIEDENTIQNNEDNSEFIGIDKDVKLLPLPDDEILYLDDEI